MLSSAEDLSRLMCSSKSSFLRSSSSISPIVEFQFSILIFFTGGRLHLVAGL